MPNSELCADLQEKSNDLDFQAKLEELKQKAATQNFESAYVMYGNATQGLLFSNEYKGTTAKPEVSLKLAISNTQANVNSIGFIHCHLDNGKTFKIFSLSDIAGLAQVAKVSTRPGSELVMYVVTASGTFAMKVNDKVSLKNIADILKGMRELNEPEFSRYVKEEMPTDKQVLGLLQYLKQKDYNYLNLYQQNTDSNSPDYGKWAKLELNQTGRQVKKTNC